MRRAGIAVVAVAALVSPWAPAASAGPEPMTEGCFERDWGYRCFYGPIEVLPEDETIPNQLDLVPAIPEPGYITSMKATLVDPDDGHVDHHEAHLHHILWANPNRDDLTCGGVSFFGLADRFFATGKERTKVEMPAGHGYWWDAESPPGYPGYPPTWAMIHHLHTMIEDYSTEVFVRFDLGFTPATETEMTDVRPVWLDVRNCTLSSEFDVDKGKGRHVERWSYAMPVGGRFVAMGGHLHDGGLKLRLDNVTQERKIFVSRPTYSKKDPWYLTKMSTYSGLPGKAVSAGDVLELSAHYSRKRNWDGAMGIMMAYMAEEL